jgi:hypothetical protein
MPFTVNRNNSHSAIIRKKTYYKKGAYCRYRYNADQQKIKKKSFLF